MATIYDMTAEWSEVADMLGDSEVDDQVIWDTLEAIEGEIEAKADGYGKVIRQLEHDMDGLAQETKRLQTRKKTLDNRTKALKKRLQEAMEIIGKEKIKTDLFSFYIQKNPPSFQMDAESVYDIPEEYLVYKEPEINAAKAIEFLKRQEGQKAEWGHLEQGRSLRIR